MSGQVEDKVLASLAGKPAVLYSVESFLDSGVVSDLVFVYRDAEQREKLSGLLEGTTLNLHWAQGGKERQNSVYNALKSLPEEIEYVFIHDCARPLVGVEQLKALREAVEADKAACLAHRVVDTIKDAGAPAETSRKLKLADLDRSRLWGMETPQVFERVLITGAYRQVIEENLSVTDDTAAVALQGHTVTLVENPRSNPKLTTPEDFAYIEFLLKRYSSTNSKS